MSPETTVSTTSGRGPLSRLGRFDPRTSIGGRLVVWFMTIAVVSCGALAWILYLRSSRALEEAYRANLTVLQRKKSDALESYALERLRDVIALAHDSATITAAAGYRSVLQQGGQLQAAREVGARYRPAVSFIADLYGYADAFLLSTDGRVLFTLNGRVTGLEEGADILQGPLRNTELAGVFDRVKTLLQAELSDFAIYPGTKEPAAFVAAPVLDRGAVAGVLIFQLRNQAIYDIVGDVAGLGETGETVVATRLGNQAVQVAPTRHDPRAAFTRRIELGSAVGSHVQQAVQGRAGSGAIVDYRGVPSIAVWSYIPSFRWGISVKQDTAEALALVTEQRRVTLWLLLGMVVPLALAALAVARSIARPVGFAAEVAARVASGDLTGRFASARNDETGALLTALRTMIDSLGLLLGQVIRSSQELNAAATRISTTATAQEANVADVSSSTHEITASVRQISATGQALVRTMTDVSAKVAGTAALADAGRSGLMDMDHSMGQMAKATETISRRLEVITEKAASINGIVVTITKVADQTNLLSLNAALEAAKAGQFGLGFAVVAREIRRLADQTAVGTLEIEETVRSMQSAVAEGVAEMAQFSAQVTRGVDASARTGEQLRLIIEQVQQLTPQFETVSEGMQAQSSGAQQINEAMVQLAAVAQSTSASIQEFMQATRELHAAVDGLQREVRRFKTGEDV